MKKESKGINNKLILKYWIIALIGSITLWHIGLAISDIIADYTDYNKVTAYPSSNKYISMSGIWTSAFSLIVYAPILEESIFRLWLKTKSSIFSISMACLMAFQVKYFTNIFSLIWVLTSVAVFLTTFIITKLTISNFLKISIDIKSNYSYIFSSLLFSIAHLTNYDLHQYNLVICLPLILPQIFTGFLFGYLRLKYSFLAGVLIHSLVNFTSFCAGLS